MQRTFEITCTKGKKQPAIWECVVIGEDGVKTALLVGNSKGNPLPPLTTQNDSDQQGLFRLYPDSVLMTGNRTEEKTVLTLWRVVEIDQLMHECTVQGLAQDEYLDGSMLPDFGPEHATMIKAMHEKLACVNCNHCHYYTEWIPPIMSQTTHLKQRGFESSPDHERFVHTDGTIIVEAEGIISIG